jgi:hypothetical protein
MKQVLALRILALILGGLFTLVQISNFSRLPTPSNAETFGYDIAWIATLALSMWAILYGLGLEIAPKKSEQV